MKRLAVALLAVLLVFLLAGCGAKEKIEQKVTEKVVEKVVEKAVSDGNTKVDIDIDEGKITVKGKEGETISIGSGKWPDIDYLPEFKQGQIISATNDGQGNVIIIEQVDQKDYEDYVEICKKNFPQETNELQLDEYLLFEGKNDKGELVAVQYFKEDNTLSIIGKRESE